MLRRSRDHATGPARIEFGGRVEILPDQGVVGCDGDEVHLTRTELGKARFRPPALPANVEALDGIVPAAELGRAPLS